MRSLATPVLDGSKYHVVLLYGHQTAHSFVIRERQHQLIRKAELTRERLLSLSLALKRLFADEQFVTLLRAERLESLPECLVQRIQ